MTRPSAFVVDAIDLERALDALPRRERAALLLSHVAGLRDRDLAAVFEVSRARIWQLRERAYRRLRDALGGVDA